MTSIDVVVPSLGGDEELGRTVAALRDVPGVTIVLVHQGPPPGREILDRVDRCLVHPRPLGFAAAANRGIEQGEGELVLLLNDDAAIDGECLLGLAEELQEDSEVAAVQPAVLDGRGRIDSLGIAWNRWWQAVQRGRGREAGAVPGEPREIFGAHAAVALYRRRALHETAVAGEVFAEALHTYYEDVELAGRLRAAGWTARVRPDRVARHVGGASAGALGSRRGSLLYGNRLLVLARFLGIRLVARLPRILTRDVLDAVRRPAIVPSVLRGWARAARLAPRFAASGPARLDIDQLRRFREA